MAMSMEIRRWFGAGLMVVATMAMATVASGRELDFSAAWQQVLTRSDALKAEQAAVDQADHNQAAAKSLYLPQISANAGYYHFDAPVQLGADDLFASMPAGSALAASLNSLAQGMGLSPAALAAGLTSTISEENVRSGSLTALWPLYTGGRISAAQDIAAAMTDEAKKGREVRMSEQFSLLGQRYFAVVLGQQLVDTRRRVEEALLIHRDHARLLVKNGQIARVEELQAEASYDKARVERSKAEQDLQIAAAALSRMLDEPESVKPLSPLFVNSTLPPLEGFVSRTLAQYPGLAVLAAKKNQAEALIKLERGKYYPEVAMLGSYSLYEEESLAAELMPDWFVGMTVSLPLIDRSGRSERTRAAESLADKVTALHRQASQDLSLLVEKTWRQAEQARTEYDGLASSLDLARQTVVLRQRAFDQGLATSLEVIDAQLYVAAVEIQRSVAAYAYVTSLLGLLAISGDTPQFASYQQQAQ